MAIVTIKRPTGFIALPKQDVTVLQKLTNDGFFEYTVNYEADPVKCIQEKITTVRISVSSRPYVRQVVPVFAGVGQDPKILTSNLLAQSPRQKDAIRAETQSYLLSVLSDISARIANDKLRAIGRIAVGGTIGLSTSRQVSTLAVSSLRQNSVNAPVLETNLASRPDAYSTDTSAGTSNLVYQRAAINLVTAQRIDPASLAGQRSNTIVPAQVTFGGIIPSAPATNQRAYQQSPQARTLVQAATSPNRLSSQIELSSRDMLPTVVQTTISSVKVSEKIRIPASALTASEFYLVFEVLGQKQETIEVLSVLVEHVKNLTQLNLVTEPPTVEQSAVSKPGKVVFYLKQVDENAFGVNVYRKEIKPKLAPVDASYSLAGRLELRPENGTRRFEDPVASLNPIVYRFVPYNREEVLSAEFTSLVVAFEKPTLLLRGTLSNRSSAVSFNCSNRSRSIEIQITNVPAEPIVLKLVRRDKTILETAWSQVSDKVLLNGAGNGSFFIEDKGVKKEHIYEYACVLIYKDGSEEFAGSSALQEFSPVESNILTMQILDPKIVRTDKGWDATFDIDYSLVKDGPEKIRDYLREQGLYGEFYQEILADKSKLNKVFGFVVLRTNMNTSEVESCGVIDSTSFSDLKYGSSSGMKPIQEGYEYRYTISAFLRNPETLFPSARRDVSIRAGSERVYALNPSRWRHPVTLRQGNIVSAASVSRNHSKSEFTFGTLVDTKQVTLSLGNVLPSIQSAQVSKANDGCLYLQWRVQGNVKLIDHFLIGMDILGMQQNVAKAHNISSTGYFQMLDKLLNKESGAITYLITPVYFDYSKGPSFKTNQVII